MELTATAVNWNNFTDAVRKDQLSDILFEEIEYDKELELDDTPWPSDSSHEYIEVAEQLIKLITPSDEMKVIASDLINEDINLPCELNGDVDPELVAGALAPATVKKYSQLFERLDMSGLSDSIVEYLNQWKEMLKFACEKDAGVYFHLG